MKPTKQAKRQAILQAAYEVLLEQGPDKTTLDDIARRANMAKTSLYYYFTDKDEIIRAIIRNDMDQMLTLMEQAAIAAHSTEAKLAALIEARYRFITTVASRATKPVISEFQMCPRLYMADWEHFQNAQKNIIEGILREGIRKQELKPMDDIELVCMIMIASMNGIDRSFASADNPERVMEVIIKMMRIYLAGLCQGSSTCIT